MVRRLATNEDLSNGQLRGRTGPMAKVSWTDLPLFTVSAGAGTSALSRAESQDGGPGYRSLSCGSAGWGNGSAIGTSFRGTGVGFRARKSTAATQGAVDLIVDGRCVEAHPTTRSKNNLVVDATWSDSEASFEFPYPLNPIQHTAYIRIDANPDGTTVNQVPVIGWMLPRSDGFRDSAPAPRRGGYTAAATVPATMNSISNTSDTSVATAAMRFINTDTGAAHTVTIWIEDGTTIFTTIVVPQATSASIPGVAVLPFNAPKLLTSWRWKVDSGSTVTGILENA